MDGRCPRSEADSSTSPFPPRNGGRHREHALEPHGLLPKPDSSRRLAGIESGAGGRCAHGRTNARAERPHYRDKLKADYARPSKDELVARFRPVASRAPSGSCEPGHPPDPSEGGRVCERIAMDEEEVRGSSFDDSTGVGFSEQFAAPDCRGGQRLPRLESRFDERLDLPREMLRP